jgi:hypothetical protein
MSRLEVDSFKTLKVISLLNLKSYGLIIVSQEFEISGLAIKKIKYAAVKN